MNDGAKKIMFNTVAVVARRLRKDIAETVLAVEQVLRDQGVAVVFEDDTAGFLPANGHQRRIMPRAELPDACDLIVVVGGDGSLLGVAREIAHKQVPVVGVNRGGLGFLAGVSPDQLTVQLQAILAGDFGSEDHFLLAAKVMRDGKEVAASTALNDVVVHPGSMAHMMEFALWINDEYVYDQRSDGLIVASPTGSTAYALSAGGPIMHPSLDAIVIVPMFPHTLTSRPLVVRGDANIRIKVLRAKKTAPRLSCDSQVNEGLQIADEVHISKFSTPLKLLYPSGHDFFESCRSKLDWASRLGGADNG
ncbi:MAG: NAD(+) kinase [Pseudomonadota bacterium]